MPFGEQDRPSRLPWKSWKNRWFTFTRDSLVFFKSDSSGVPHVDEDDPAFHSIGVNNSGSVLVKEDEKLLTITFPHGNDRKSFSVKAEMPELCKWKMAIENAFKEESKMSLVMGNNEISHGNLDDTCANFLSQWGEEKLVRSTTIRKPISSFLEDVDNGPFFLDKALQFLENYGFKAEGILRQSADVEEVIHRIEEFDQGKTDFEPDEDAHVVGDCVKHILRMMPTSLVPESSSDALLNAYKIEENNDRISALRLVIMERFPESNRHLFQRVLKMMKTVSSHAHENRMTIPAVAACMAPLLLQSFIVKNCRTENKRDDMNANSAQLLAATNAVNTAQAIIILLLEEYDNIFETPMILSPQDSDTFHADRVFGGENLEATKIELRQRIAKEIRGNEILTGILQQRKQDLHVRCLTLEQDVSRLHQQVEVEENRKDPPEVDLSISSKQCTRSWVPNSETVDEIEELPIPSSTDMKEQHEPDSFLDLCSNLDTHLKFQSRDFVRNSVSPNHDWKAQREASLVGPVWWNMEGPEKGPGGNNNKHYLNENLNSFIQHGPTVNSLSNLSKGQFSSIHHPLRAAADSQQLHLHAIS